MSDRTFMVVALLVIGAIFRVAFLLTEPRPVVRELGIDTVYVYNGGLVLIYRYSIDGADQQVMLSDEVQLGLYREYLGRVATFYRRRFVRLFDGAPWTWELP